MGYIWLVIVRAVRRILKRRKPTSYGYSRAARSAGTPANILQYRGWGIFGRRRPIERRCCAFRFVITFVMWPVCRRAIGMGISRTPWEWFYLLLVSSVCMRTVSIVPRVWLSFSAMHRFALLGHIVTMTVFQPIRTSAIIEELKKVIFWPVRADLRHKSCWETGLQKWAAILGRVKTSWWRSARTQEEKKYVCNCNNLCQGMIGGKKQQQVKLEGP